MIVQNQTLTLVHAAARQLVLGNPAQCHALLVQHIEEERRLGREPDTEIMRVANYIDLGLILDAKAVLIKMLKSYP